MEELAEVRVGCGGDDLPGLAGGWVVWCGRYGAAPEVGWWALRLADRRAARLEGMGGAADGSDGSAEGDERVGAILPGLAEGAVYVAGRGGGRWLLPEGEVPAAIIAAVGTVPTHDPGISAPGLIRLADGSHRAVLAREGQIEVYALDGKARQTVRAAPLPQQAPALIGERAAWVERGPGGLDLWWWRPGGAPEPLRAGPAEAHRVVGDGRRLAWVEGGDVWLMEGEEIQMFEADAGFLHAPALWGGEGAGGACWEDRAGADVDVRCSDGVEIRRPGDQLAPWRWGRWLLFREQRRVMLAWLEGG